MGGARTPFAVWRRGRTGDGKRGGALAKDHPFDLGADACRAALVKTGVSPESVDFLVFGNVYQIGPNACYGGRYVSLRAGLAPELPSLTVNMACGTGLSALISASREIVAGGVDTVLSVGADTASLIDKSIFIPSFHDQACGREIGETVQTLAAREGIDRAAMDAWSLESHRRARAARDFQREEIVGDGIDDAVLEDPGPEAFANAKVAHEGAVTSRNTHAIVDGASALVLSATRLDGALGLLLASATVGIEPDRMGVASVAAIKKLLTEAARSVEEIDLFEINETFAAQLLLDIRELNIPKEKVNVNGGGIAFGHPFAATGGKLVLGLLLELGRRGLKTGVASICVGGGLGVAVLVERL